jgi:hypothetical protein
MTKAEILKRLEKYQDDDVIYAETNTAFVIFNIGSKEDFFLNLDK